MTVNEFHCPRDLLSDPSALVEMLKCDHSATKAISVKPWQSARYYLYSRVWRRNTLPRLVLQEWQSGLRSGWLSCPYRERRGTSDVENGDHVAGQTADPGGDAEANRRHCRRIVNSMQLARIIPDSGDEHARQLE